MCMRCILLSLGAIREEGNEAREVVRGQIMKGPWKLLSMVLEGQIILEADKHGGLKQWCLIFSCVTDSLKKKT